MTDPLRILHEAIEGGTEESVARKASSHLCIPNLYLALWERMERAGVIHGTASGEAL